ncbi:MAG TPA: VOC family protein [Patescibacteria group bacterium]|nr:VOC family protein [Patescibacteria group bacterium]
MQKITPFLWFDKEAGEAAKYYVSVFKNSKVTDTNPMSASFNLDGQDFIALNGGPQYKFTEAISMFVSCEDQKEIDYFWNKFIDDGGEESMCGWLKDKYGLSWQIVPKNLPELISKPEALQAMLKMHKLVIEDLKNA